MDAAVVVNDWGECIWRRGNRILRNQILAIRENAESIEQSGVAVCLDKMLELEGVMGNSQYLLSKGQSVQEILADNLENTRVLDLTGCSLDAILFYVNKDIPVLTLLNNGEALLIIGFNEYNITVLDPLSGKITKRGMKDSTELFLENGNCFITYIKKQG